MTGSVMGIQPWMVLIDSVYPGLQVHLWTLFTTTHSVLEPHGFGLHCFIGFTHGMAGGFPSNLGKQQHTGRPASILHPEFGPHLFPRHFLASLMHLTNGFPVLP